MKAYRLERFGSGARIVLRSVDDPRPGLRGVLMYVIFYRVSLGWRRHSTRATVTGTYRGSWGHDWEGRPTAGGCKRSAAESR
jgi:hypothetical protein